MPQAGANPALADNEQQSAMDYAQAGGFADVLALLRQVRAGQMGVGSHVGPVVLRVSSGPVEKGRSSVLRALRSQGGL